jgi:hypothetical protein
MRLANGKWRSFYPPHSHPVMSFSLPLISLFFPLVCNNETRENESACLFCDCAVFWGWIIITAFQMMTVHSKKREGRVCVCVCVERKNSFWRTSARWKAGAALSNDKIRYLSVDPYLMNSVVPRFYFLFLIFCLSIVSSSLPSVYRWNIFLLGLCLLAFW